MSLSKIFKRIKNWWMVSNYYRPYFNNLDASCSYIKPVKLVFDKRIEDIYLEIKKTDPVRYRKEIELYDNLQAKVDKHNDEVKRINKACVTSISFEDFIKNPNLIDKNEIELLNEVALLINNYKRIDEDKKKFIKKITDIKNNYDAICEQHNLIPEYESLFDFSSFGYVDSKQMKEARQRVDNFCNKLGKYKTIFYPFDKSVLTYIEAHNDEYIDEHMYDKLLNDIRGKSLDIEQRIAVLTDETSTLVVAGAGSGKTLTICGKVEYLIQRQNVSPEDILLLSYSKKSADDLQSKINAIDSRMKVGTFHAIGLDILSKVNKKKYVIEEQFNAIIESYFRDEIKNRPNMLTKVLQYYALFISPISRDKKYENKGDLYIDLKSNDYNTLKNQLLSLSNNKDKKETIKKELVKSYQEMQIANWYFINGIDYEYEKRYEFDTATEFKRQYTPDFYLPDGDVYHEHYGIDKDGKASQFNGEDANNYLDSMRWKRELHELNKTACIETYSYEFEDGTIFDKLRDEIKKYGLNVKPLSEGQIKNALDSIYHGQSFKSFINLICTFINLYKSRYRNESEFEKLLDRNFSSVYQRLRAIYFLDIAKDVYLYYMESIRCENKIDFDDMILLATDALDETQGYKYKYVIVDEFQDISISRMEFLKKIISHGNSKLFAVGDDWQSIYRFSGCDIDIFLNFKDYFGDCKTTKITTTHRNSQDLQNILGPFIRKNPEQIDKEIKSETGLSRPIQVMYYQDNKSKAFMDIIKRIHNKESKANVLVLGRNKSDLNTIELDKRIYRKISKDGSKTSIVVSGFEDMNIYFNTVHSSKGLEEDYVILINAEDGRTGFPNKMEDDELLELVLSHKSNFEYGEERRLWYVALTRTRSFTFIMAKANQESIFLKEIMDECTVMNSNFDGIDVVERIACPDCKSGRMVLRTNQITNNNFYGCSNYPYCTYTIDNIDAVQKNKRCPNCGDFLILKKGRYGMFYSCHSYPKCRYKTETK